MPPTMKQFLSARACLGTALITALLAAGACKKEGVNTNLDPKDQKDVDFMSTKSGTYWKYGSRDGVNYTRYARGKDTVRNGKTFSYYERQDTGGNLLPEYFGKRMAHCQLRYKTASGYFTTLFFPHGGCSRCSRDTASAAREAGKSSGLTTPYPGIMHPTCKRASGRLRGICDVWTEMSGRISGNERSALPRLPGG